MKYCKIFTLFSFFLFFLNIDASAQCSSIIKGGTFNGSFNSGTAADPDIVCPLNKIVYEVKPPSGYTNAQFGSLWVITSLTFKTFKGTNAKDTILTLPTASNNGRLTFVPKAIFADSVFILTATLQTFSHSCDTTLVRYVKVAPVPNAAFLPSANLICLGEVISFSDNSSGSGLSRLWDFGDGSKTTTTSPNYTYTTAGNYKVKLIVTNSNGCKDSTDETVIVSPYPKPNFTISDNTPCIGESISFTNTSTNTDLPAYEYKFGDDSTALTANATHAYTAAGTYDVWLIVTNGPGCIDSIKKQVVVSAKPSVSFSGNNVCKGKATVFTNTSSSGTGITYLWKFDDGGTATDQNPTHTFKTTGQHTVRLYVTGPGGCTDSSSSTVTVYGVTSDFAVMNACEGDTFYFYDSSTVSGGTITSYIYDFGDGTHSTDQNPIHFYWVPDDYPVRLIVTSSNGCTDTILKKVSVYPLPVATYTWDTTQLSVTFTPTDGSQAQYRWDFGNGDVVTTKAPTYVYDSSGTYLVTLRVTSINGCVSEFSDSVTVFEDTASSIFEKYTESIPFSVYPNPFTDKVNLIFELKEPVNLDVLVYDASGKLVITKHKGTLSAGKHAVTIREKLTAGTYFIHLTAGGRTMVRQVVRVEK